MRDDFIRLTAVAAGTLFNAVIIGCIRWAWRRYHPDPITPKGWRSIADQVTWGFYCALAVALILFMRR